MAQARAPRLSAQDMMQLDAEAAGARMQFAAVLVLDGAPTLAMVRSVLGARLPAVPRLRQRLVRRAHGRPVWVPDAGFDLARQVDEVGCPAPGDRAAVLAVAARIVPQRLSLARPPWRITLVSGLAGGRSALIIVLHHVLADGLAGLAVLAGLVDGPAPAPSAAPEPVHPGARGLALVRAAAAELLGNGWQRAPRCSINAGPIDVGGPHRTLAVAQEDLAAVIGAGRAAGGTVNDVVLTAVTGALGAALAERGEVLDRLVVSVPISARVRAGSGELGNRVGVLPVSVPLAGAPRDRLPAVAVVTRARKTEIPGASTVLWSPFVRLLAGVGAFGAFIGHQRLVNTFVTNVRGPAERMTIGRFPVLELIPVAPISGNVGVAFSVLSYAGRLTITVAADATRCPDGPRVAQLVQDQLAALTRPG